MAVNKVQRADGTVEIDITDTTATPEDVAEGKTFYQADGLKGTGTATGGVFVAVYEQTPYADITAAIDEHKAIVLDMPANNNQFCMTYSTYTNGGNALMYAIYKMSDKPTLMTVTLTPQNQWTTTHTDLQDKLVSGTSIKTINNTSLLGSGNIDTTPPQATETVSGTSKLNPSQNIDVDEYGRLVVGGRIGQFEGTTGLFAPNDRQPRQVSDYSFLVTDALGMSIGNRAFAVVSGYGLACKSAAAGSTEYRITNNYNNRIIAKMAEGGFASRDEATSKVEQIIPVVSVTINGSAFTPDSAANSSNDIIIKTAETLNPDSAITNIRLFGIMGAYATVHTGNGIKSETGGRNLLLGGGVTKAGSGNDNCIVGNGMYSSGNGNAMFGRFHIARKNRGLLAGTGHDTTNAPSEGASAVGQYSYMDANTLFAVGNGSSHTDRKNAFEVRTDGIVLRSPNGTRFKVTVDDGGNLSTSPI